MASFDIKSLFTNIPLDEAINIATDSLFPQNDVSLLGLTSECFENYSSLLSKMFCSSSITNFTSKLTVLQWVVR